MSVPPFLPPVPEPLHEQSWDRPAGNLDFRVTQGFDDINPDFPVQHRALDLGNSRLGAPITAPGAGVVVAEGWLTEPWSESSTRFGTGNYGGIMVVIDHGNGYFSAFAHLADSIVSAGQPVLDHQLIGHLGDTGSAKGQGHVHWDLYKGRPTAAMTYAQRVALKVDPWPLLKQNYRLPDTATAPEDDMLAEKTTFRTASFRARLLPGTAIRSDTRIADDTLIDRTPTSGDPVELTVIGTAEGDEYQGSTTWWVYGIHNRSLGTFHSKAATAIPVPAPAPDRSQIDAAVAAALAAHNKNLDTWAAARPKS